MSSQPPRGPDWPHPGSTGRPGAAPGDPGDPSGRGGPGASGAPDGPGGRTGPGRTGRALAVVAAAVAAIAVGASGGAWLARQGQAPNAVSTAPATGPSTPAGAPSVSSSASPSASQDQALSAVAQVDAAAARTQAKQAGIPVVGRAVEAWTWTDRNGRNLLLTTRSVDKAEGEIVRAATLRVYHVGRLDTAPKQLLTPLRDSGEAGCDVDFALDFVPGSIAVTDTDRDGYGEASVGWASLCSGDPQPLRVKLALLTEGTYYILRGQGQRAADPPPPPGITFPKASFTPNLPAPRWPAGSYQQTVRLFRTLFR